VSTNSTLSRISVSTNSTLEDICVDKPETLKDICVDKPGTLKDICVDKAGTLKDIGVDKASTLEDIDVDTIPQVISTRASPPYTCVFTTKPSYGSTTKHSYGFTSACGFICTCALSMFKILEDSVTSLRVILSTMWTTISRTHERPNYNLWFGDGESFELSSDMTVVKREVGGQGSCLAWLAEPHAHYEVSVSGVLHKNFTSILNLLRWTRVFQLHPIESRASGYLYTEKRSLLLLGACIWIKWNLSALPVLRASAGAGRTEVLYQGKILAVANRRR
jgi:hypothetical protein